MCIVLRADGQRAKPSADSEDIVVCGDFEKWLCLTSFVCTSARPSPESLWERLVDEGLHGCSIIAAVPSLLPESTSSRRFRSGVGGWVKSFQPAVPLFARRLMN